MIAASPIEAMEADLVRAQNHWQKSRRGENSVPFADDINLAALSSLERSTVLLQVFYDPTRFRVEIAGRRIEDQYGEPIAGKFLDEIKLRPPLDALPAQCRRAINTRSPSYWRHKPAAGSKEPEYARLILPFWDNGRVDKLLVAISPRQSGERR
jgi:hypothetical protein